MNVKLKDYITNNQTQGYFIFLGFISWVEPDDFTNPNHPNNRGITEPNGISMDCHGMGDEFENTRNRNNPLHSIVDWVQVSTNNPYGSSGLAAVGQRMSFNHEIDFSSYSNGYYGFMYVDNDSNLNSVNDEVIVTGKPELP